MVTLILHCTELIVDPSPPKEKIKKCWSRYDLKDPNLLFNLQRANCQLPLEDVWNIGVEYVWNGMSLIFDITDCF